MRHTLQPGSMLLKLGSVFALVSVATACAGQVPPDPALDGLSGVDGGDGTGGYFGAGGSPAAGGDTSRAGSTGTGASPSTGGYTSSTGGYTSSTGGYTSSGGTSGCFLGICAAGGAGGMSSGGTTSSGGTSGAGGATDQCANEICWDIFDCFIFHPNAGTCGFTKCEGFICKP